MIYYYITVYIYTTSSYECMHIHMIKYFFKKKKRKRKKMEKNIRS